VRDMCNLCALLTCRYVRLVMCATYVQVCARHVQLTCSLCAHWIGPKPIQIDQVRLAVHFASKIIQNGVTKPRFMVFDLRWGTGPDLLRVLRISSSL